MSFVNPAHVIFVAAIALIVLGPKRLPELTRALGHGLREFREGLEGMSSHTQQEAPVEHVQSTYEPPPQPAPQPQYVPPPVPVPATEALPEYAPPEAP